MQDIILLKPRTKIKACHDLRLLKPRPRKTREHNMGYSKFSCENKRFFYFPPADTNFGKSLRKP